MAKQYSDRIQVVFKPEDGQLIKQLADGAGLSVSGFCKQLILNAIRPEVDTTQVLPIDTTLSKKLDTTYNTTYVTTQDAASEYSRLWDAITALSDKCQATKEIVTTPATTVDTTCSSDLEIDTTDYTTVATTEPEPATNLDTTVVTTLKPSAILPIKELVVRLANDVPMGVLTDKLITMDDKHVGDFTRTLDPDGYVWIPTDKRKQRWAVQKV